MKLKIWERYFYKEIITTFLFLLFSFYGMYIIMDLMAHMKDIREGHTAFRTWTLFYLCNFSKRLDVLVPFVVLIGTIRVLLLFQSSNILVALLSSGISLKKLLQPFLVVTLFASALLYINYECFLPQAQPRVQFIQENSFSKKAFVQSRTLFRECILKDGSKVLYRSYNPAEKSFYDVFWVASMDKIYHMKSLACFLDVPSGKMVDLIQRQSSGHMHKKESFVEVQFPTMHFDLDALQRSITSPRDQSLTQLISEMYRSGLQSERSHEAFVNLLYKCSYPLVLLLAFFAVTPFCMRFTRTMAPFIIYLLAISGLFCFLLLLQVLFVLAKTHSAPALLVFILPWSAAFYIVLKKPTLTLRLFFNMIFQVKKPQTIHP